MSAALTPRQGLVAFMATLAGPDPDGFLELRHRRPGAGMRQRFFDAHQPNAAATAASVLAQTGDVYVGCAPRRVRAGGKQAVGQGWVLWVDCDDPQAIAAMQRFEPQPAIVVRTSGRGLHAYWPLQQPLPPDELERANRRLAHALDADPACAEVARILRPPATLSWKHEPPFAVTLERNSGERLDPERVVGGLPDPPRRPPRRLPADPVPTRLADPLLTIAPAAYVRALTGREVGRDGKVACPFHPDRTPSLHAYPDPARGWACFSARCLRRGRHNGGDIYELASQLWLTGQSSTAGGRRPLRGREFIEVRQRLLAMFFGDGAAGG